MEKLRVNTANNGVVESTYTDNEAYAELTDIQQLSIALVCIDSEIFTALEAVKKFDYPLNATLKIKAKEVLSSTDKYIVNNK